VVDEMFLYDKYKETLLAVITLERHNNILPIVFTIV